jgi:hypothetical protein
MFPYAKLVAVGACALVMTSRVLCGFVNALSRSSSAGAGVLSTRVRAFVDGNVDGAVLGGHVVAL